MDWTDGCLLLCNDNDISASSLVKLTLHAMLDRLYTFCLWQGVRYIASTYVTVPEKL